MFYNVLKLNDVIDSKDKQFHKVELMKHNESCLGVVAIQKDAIIDTHTSVEDAAVYVFEGEIEVHFDAEKFNVKKGELLMFKKDAQHKVLALKDSKFLIIKI